jgi:cell division septation protein DedD
MVEQSQTFTNFEEASDYCQGLKLLGYNAHIEHQLQPDMINYANIWHVVYQEELHDD